MACRTSYLTEFGLVELCQRPFRILDQVVQAAHAERPALRVLPLIERRSPPELTPEVDWQPLGKIPCQLVRDSDTRRRGRWKEPAEPVSQWGGLLLRLRGGDESDDILDPFVVVGVGQWDGNPLHASDRVASQSEREPAGIFVVIQVASDVDAWRAGLFEDDVADEVAGIDEPVFPHGDRRPKVHSIQIELGTMTVLIAYPSEHVVDRGLVRADVERFRPLPGCSRGNALVSAHHPAGLRGEARRWVEVPRRPVRVRARVIPGKPRDPFIV